MNQPILNQLIVDAPKTKTIWPQPHTSHFLQGDSFWWNSHEFPLQTSWQPSASTQCMVSTMSSVLCLQQGRLLCRTGVHNGCQSQQPRSAKHLETTSDSLKLTQWAKDPLTEFPSQDAYRLHGWPVKAGWSVHSTAIHIWVYRCVYI